MDSYKKTIKDDIALSSEYFKKSIVKTEQQKMLERLLDKDDSFLKAKQIADICTGGGH
ncbi:MAG: hypothetical protein LDLANPLL_01637 [Turneriella sp.]|nr:hypothetical protein [Turneriella sp.]